MQSVRKHWLIYTILLLLLTSGILAWGIWQKTRFDRSSRDAVRETIDAVLYGERYSMLVDNALDSQINGRPAPGFANEMSAMKRTLGGLSEVSGIYGEAKVPLVNIFAAPIVANYEADLQFANGPATLKITMQLIDGSWLTRLFLIESRSLIN